MKNEVNTSLDARDSIVGLVKSKNFVNLESDLQFEIVQSLNEGQSKSGGFIGKLLGIDARIASMNIAFIICVLLISLLILNFISSFLPEKTMNMDMFDKILPVITVALGYLFGKGNDK